MNKDEVLKIVKEEIIPEYRNKIFAAFLFGSYNNGDYTPESDVDLLFISPEFEWEPKLKIMDKYGKEFSILEVNKKYLEESIQENKNDVLNRLFRTNLHSIINEEYILNLKKQSIKNKLICYKKWWDKDTEILIKRIYWDEVKYFPFLRNKRKEKIEREAKLVKNDFEEVLEELKKEDVKGKRPRIIRNTLQTIYFAARAARGVKRGYYLKKILQNVIREIS